MAALVLSVASSCFFPPVDRAAQNWKSDESTKVEETFAEEDQDWNDDSDADWTIDSEGHSSLSEGCVCKLVAYDGQASLRRSISVRS